MWTTETGHFCSVLEDRHMARAANPRGLFAGGMRAVQNAARGPNEDPFALPPATTP